MYMISYLNKSSLRNCFSMLKQYPIKSRFIAYQDGSPSKLNVQSREIKCQQDQLIMKVKAIGLNRAECLQRAGKYPPSKKQQEKFLGLQASGQIFDPNSKEKIFDGMALLSGGSYGQWINVPRSHIIPIPKGLNYIQSAAIPQAWLTAFQLLRIANLNPGQSFVIYAGASGVGTAAIQIGNTLKLNPFAVCSTQQKAKVCTSAGAKGVAFYKQNPNWPADLLKANEGKMFNAVLDCVGSDNVDNTIKLLDIDSKWVLFGLLSGGKTNLNLAQLLGKRIQLIPTTLKTRSKEYKDQLIQQFNNLLTPQFQSKNVKPIIDVVLKQQTWQNADAFIKGHQIMESNKNSGKIIIEYP